LGTGNFIETGSEKIVTEDAEGNSSEVTKITQVEETVA
jgi:hypothetical protein